ncbi:hypothetical protein pb186bvf_005828 [Paramecium bursaria]
MQQTQFQHETLGNIQPYLAICSQLNFQDESIIEVFSDQKIKIRDQKYNLKFDRIFGDKEKNLNIFNMKCQCLNQKISNLIIILYLFFMAKKNKIILNLLNVMKKQVLLNQQFKNFCQMQKIYLNQLNQNFYISYYEIQNEVQKDLLLDLNTDIISKSLVANYEELVGFMYSFIINKIKRKYFPKLQKCLEFINFQRYAILDIQKMSRIK